MANDMIPDQVVALIGKANKMTAKIVNSQHELNQMGAVYTDYKKGYYDDEP
jgi:hypothetical protein